MTAFVKKVLEMKHDFEARLTAAVSADSTEDPIDNSGDDTASE